MADLEKSIIEEKKNSGISTKEIIFYSIGALGALFGYGKTEAKYEDHFRRSDERLFSAEEKIDNLRQDMTKVQIYQYTHK